MVLGLVWRLSQKTTTQPIGPALGEQKIRRGGAWFNGSDIRVHSRLRKDPAIDMACWGFDLYVQPLKTCRLLI